MLEDFSSNAEDKRTYAYTILFLDLKTLNVCRFICQNLQFCWSQTSHTNSSDEILKPFTSEGILVTFSQLYSVLKSTIPIITVSPVLDELIPTIILTLSASTLLEHPLADNANVFSLAYDIAVTDPCFIDIQLTSLSPRNYIPPEELCEYTTQPALIDILKKLLVPKPEPLRIQSPNVNGTSYVTKDPLTL
ncbi:hypothetical protein Tco_0991931 [Tanacetum coccineum]|uniref:Uncharacterized protein n=1 Tax=Tanacetum coccineum TaxID=301880 RepID=A0ABQ5F2C3_9ASTR